MRKLRTITRCEAEHEVGLAGPDRLAGDEHTIQCDAPATRLLRVHDELLEYATEGDGLDTWVLCDADRDRLVHDANTLCGLQILSDEPLPEEA